MKKIILSIALAGVLALPSQKAYAYSVVCVNCSTIFTQIMEQVTNLDQLQSLYNQYAEEVKQTMQQIELVKNNIQQYENMLKNTENLPDNILSFLSNELGELAMLTNDLKTLKADVSTMGTIFDTYYPEQDYYKDIAGLANTEVKNGNMIIRSEFDDMSRRIDDATKATFQLSGQQLKDLHDTGELENYINKLLQTPEGQMQALSSANQLSALQLQESRQLRELMATSIQSDLASQIKDEKKKQLSEEIKREINKDAGFDYSPQGMDL